MDQFKPKPRTVTIDSIGSVNVRRPTYAEMVAFAKDLDALGPCCTRTTGEPLFPPGGPRLSEIDCSIANELVEEVMRKHPTQPPNGGSGGLPVMQSA